MVIDELLLSSSFHAFEWVESSLKITFEGFASSDNLSHDFVSLFFGNTRTKWVVSQVSSNSDSSGVDHSGFVFSKFSVFNSVGGHVRGVLSFWSVLVVVGDALVEELVEASVSVVRTGIDTNTRVLILNTGENASFESNALGAFLVLVFFPNFFGEACFELRLAVLGEEGIEVNQLIRGLEGGLFL